MPDQMTPTECKAAAIAAAAYAEARAGGYLNLGGSRLRRHADRVQASAVAAIYTNGHARGMLHAGLVYEDAVPTVTELITALAYEVRPRLLRAAVDEHYGHPRAASTRNAVRRACRALDLELDDVAPGLEPELEQIRARDRTGRMVTA